MLPTKYIRSRFTVRPEKMREALSVAKEEQDEASSRPVSRRSSARQDKAEGAFFGQKVGKHHQNARRVAEQGSRGRAGDAHAQILHKDNVQHDVHSVGGNDRAHGQHLERSSRMAKLERTRLTPTKGDESRVKKA